MNLYKTERIRTELGLISHEDYFLLSMSKVFFSPMLILIQFTKVKLQNVTLVFIPGKKNVSNLMGNTLRT